MTADPGAAHAPRTILPVLEASPMNTTSDSQLDTCPICGRAAVVRPFDITVHADDGGERHFFALPAAFCRPCGQLAVDPDAMRLLGIDGLAIASAIQSAGSLLAMPDVEAA
jgi:hypothetical protein